MTDPSDRVREMLTTRSADIREVPPALLTQLADVGRDARRPRSVQHWLVAASAAAVLAIGTAGAAIAVHAQDSALHRPPMTSPSTPLRPTTRSTPPRPTPRSPRLCAAVDRTNWTHAISAGYVNHNIMHANLLLGVDSHGTAFDFRFDSLALVQISPAGALSTVVARQTGLRGVTVAGASLDDHFVALAVPVDGAGGPMNIELVDRATKQGHLIRQAAANETTIVLGPALLDGHVYWTEVDDGAGRVWDYAIDTGVTRAIGEAATAPIVSGGGLYWTNTAGHLIVYRRGTLPRDFTPTPGKDYGGFAADHGAAAWLRYRGGVPQVVLTTRYDAAPRVVAQGEELAGAVDALSGPLLFWHTAEQRFVLDTRTGVIATGFARQPPVAAAGVIFLPIDNGDLSVVRTATLAPLRCG